MKKFIALSLLAISTNSFSFDLGDYEATYKVARDAHRDADMDYRLAESDFLGVLKNSFTTLSMRDAVLISTQGVKLNTCTYWSLCQSAQTESKVKSTLSRVINDAVIKKTVDAGELSGFRVSMNTYYDTLDASLHKDEEILFKAQATSVTGDILDYTDVHGNPQESFYGTSMPGDPATTSSDYRTIRNAYNLYLNRIKLARAPAHAAKAAYAKALQMYYNYDNCANWGSTKSVEDMIKDGDIDPLNP